ncbi:MAG: tripartite tricarboxylate transporter substrate binding protein [Thermodesulfovibrionales bacterium]|nr:tripartite tricarboxylate transporter substrate binding protein [Thermodesulfovibrionales bacterium]
MQQKSRWIILLVVILISLLSFTVLSVSASEYPNRPIKLLTMVGPGAQIDLLTRDFANRLSQLLGQPVLVSNLAGGSHGSVMATELASAKPDGYTLGVSAVAAFTYAPFIVPLKYKFEDFDYISLLAVNQSGIICKADRPWKNLKDAFKWAKENNKTLVHMFQGVDDKDIMTRIAAKEGVKISLMPSQGGPSIIQAVLGGHVDTGHVGAIMFTYIEAKKLKALAATTPYKLTPLPDVPTLIDLGWDERMEMTIVLVAPKGLPENVKSRLDKAMDSLGKNKEFQKFISDTLNMRNVEFGRKAAQEYMKASYTYFKAHTGK